MLYVFMGLSFVLLSLLVFFLIRNRKKTQAFEIIFTDDWNKKRVSKLETFFIKLRSLVMYGINTKHPHKTKNLRKKVENYAIAYFFKEINAKIRKDMDLEYEFSTSVDVSFKEIYTSTGLPAFMSDKFTPIALEAIKYIDKAYKDEGYSVEISITEVSVNFTISSIL